MVSPKPTCGPLYKSGLERFTGMDPALMPIFAAGFVSGEAEKVYLGACRAAMFRPSDQEWAEKLLVIIEDVAARYGLLIEMLQTSRGSEIWLCRDEITATIVRTLPDMKENSGQWHEHRGYLCGVPIPELDFRFHERSGYGECCDR